MFSFIVGTRDIKGDKNVIEVTQCDDYHHAKAAVYEAMPTVRTLLILLPGRETPAAAQITEQAA